MDANQVFESTSASSFATQKHEVPSQANGSRASTEQSVSWSYNTIICGIACYFIDPIKGLPNIIVAGSLLFNAPYSFLSLIPKYVTPIIAEDTVDKEKMPEDDVRQMVTDWGFFHGVRTLVDVVSFFYCAFSIVYS